MNHLPFLTLSLALALGAWAPASAQQPSDEDRAVLELAERGLEVAHTRFQTGTLALEDLVVWERRVLEARLVVDPDHAEDHLQAWVDVLQHVEANTLQRVEVGAAGEDDLLAARYHLRVAQARLAHAH